MYSFRLIYLTIALILGLRGPLLCSEPSTGYEPCALTVGSPTGCSVPSVPSKSSNRHNSATPGPISFKLRTIVGPIGPHLRTKYQVDCFSRSRDIAFSDTCTLISAIWHTWPTTGHISTTARPFPDLFGCFGRPHWALQFLQVLLESVVFWACRSGQCNWLYLDTYCIILPLGRCSISCSPFALAQVLQVVSCASQCPLLTTTNHL